MIPTIVALDLSLTATGISTPDQTTVLKTDQLRGMTRLAHIRNHILQHKADLYVLEHYSYASPNQAHQLGELGGVIRLALHDNGHPYVDIAPTTLKKVATGRGNATKSDMRAELIKRAGIDLRDDNRVDAWWLRHLALTHYGNPPFPLPKAQLELIEKVQWPTFDEEDCL